MRARRTWLLPGVTWAATLLAACGLDAIGSFRTSVPLPDEDAETPDATSQTDAPFDHVNDVALFRCPEAGRGPEMVLIRPDGGAPFCIDSTEVSADQYFAILEAGVSAPAIFAEAGAMADACAANTTLAPKQPVAGGALPIVNVTWCDAYAFCKWAGKELCDFSDAGLAVSHWTRACSGESSFTYPYGDTYDAGACNVASGALKEVGTSEKCEGAYPGVFDMSGNAGEWTAACRPDPGGVVCAVAGGNLYSTPDDSTCTASTEYAPDGYYYAWGFRCCASENSEK